MTDPVKTNETLRFAHRSILCLFLTLLALALTGCASGTATQIHAPTATLHVNSVESAEEPSAVAVPESIRSRFQAQLDEALYTDNHFQRGSELKIRWQLAAYDEGSRALRYLVGFGAGRGKIVVRARFVDSKNREVAAIQSEGSITMGAFGGSYEAALSECAEAIANYTRDNFTGGALR